MVKGEEEERKREILITKKKLIKLVKREYRSNRELFNLINF